MRFTKETLPDKDSLGQTQAKVEADPRPPARQYRRKTDQAPPRHPEAYWHERKQYLANIKGIPELRRRYLRSMLIYLLRRFLWSFGFFPVFIAFWVPFVLSWFNPVVMVTDLLPSLQAFVNANPEVQAHTEQTLIIAWLSIGFFFAVFDLVLTPFKSPYEYEADVHMRAWEQRYLEDNPGYPSRGPGR